MANFTGTMAGHDVTGDWWAWIPLVGVGVIGSIWARGFRPLRILFKSLWKDWTLLSFAFYGALPLLFLAAYDEVHNQAPILSGIMLVLAAGMIIYMRTETLWHRLASLVGGFTLGWSILMIHQGIYWNGRQEFWMQQPGTWTETLAWTSSFGATLMLYLVTPTLIEILRQVAKSRQNPKTAG